MSFVPPRMQNEEKSYKAPVAHSVPHEGQTELTGPSRPAVPTVRKAPWPVNPNCPSHLICIRTTTQSQRTLEWMPPASLLTALPHVLYTDN